MSQTRLGSLIEAAVNIAVGFIFNVSANLALLPALGYDVTTSDVLSLSVFMTVIAIARNYGVRRLFVWYHQYRDP